MAERSQGSAPPSKPSAASRGSLQLLPLSQLVADRTAAATSPTTSEPFSCHRGRGVALGTG
eukprot:12139240-Alexandrium_andersonii.AAC.1